MLEFVQSLYVTLMYQELRDEMRLTEPQLFKTDIEFPEEYLIPAMKKDMDSMKKFDVYDEVPLSERTPDNQWCTAN